MQCQASSIKIYKTALLAYALSSHPAQVLKQVTRVREYVILICRAAEELRDDRIVAPGKYTGVRTILGEKMVWPVNRSAHDFLRGC